MKTQKRIVLSSNQDRQTNHRADFKTCPHCDYEMEHDEWHKVAVTLVLQPRNYKSGSVAVLSECPKCFEKSWTHESMDCFAYHDEFPQAWIDRVDKLAKQTKLYALRAWGSGICHSCMHLSSGTIDYHAWRSCILGSGPVQKDCEDYDPLED